MKWFLRRAALLTATIALAVAAVGKADAQVSKALTVAVLTFSNSSGVGGALLGNSAAAAVETQLIGSSRYDVVKKETVEKTMTDLNLTYPLGRIGIQQLASALEADDVISGDVTRVVSDSKTGQVKVMLRVEMTDRTSGELVNGAIATGESGIRPDFTGSQSVLIDEALNKAAFSAVRSMTERILPEGTVFATSSSGGSIEALLNIGSNSGVRPGMEFIVLRNREQVGRLRITSVAATDSKGAVIATTRGVQPEDKVRAVFRLENIPTDLGGTGAATNGSLHRNKLNIGGVLMGGAMLLGLTKLTSGSLSKGPGARNATARSSGPFNGAPYPNDIPDVPINHIKWSPPTGVKRSDILGYAVYRLDRPSGTQNAVWILDGANTDIYDTGRARDIAAMEPFAATKADGLDAGAPTRYVIRTAYNKTTTDGTGGGTGGGTTTTVAYATDVVTGAATGLIPPTTQATLTTTLPTDPTALAAVPFHFRAVPGGDRYVIQIADNPQFTNADQFPKGDEGMAIAPPPSLMVMWFGEETDVTVGGNTVKVCVPGGSQNCTTAIDDPRLTATTTLQPTYAPDETMTINLLTSRFDFSTGSFYWRVGVRNSRDDLRPENGGWVWGEMATLNQAGTALRAKPMDRRGPGKGPVRLPGPGRPTTSVPDNGGVDRGGRGR